jgi:pimeloyl-ACP methyl ester carboxylesterase
MALNQGKMGFLCTQRPLLSIVIAISVCSLFGCQNMVENEIFYPDTTNVLPADKLPLGVEEIMLETEDKIKIQSYFLANESSSVVLIYFHGNAGNISTRLATLMKIFNLGVNVLGVGYRGYGRSQGNPSEAGVYIDGKSALNYATHDLGFEIENVLILGRSLGTAVAINTAQNRDIAGLILISPFTNAIDLARASGFGVISSLAGKAFNSIDKAANIVCPVLIIHGTNDRITPITMAEEIHEKIGTEKVFVRIDGAAHNNIKSSKYESQFWHAISKFIASVGN